MTSSHSKARNASSSLGFSAAPSRLVADKKREFDLRVLALTREFEDLKSGDSDGVTLADLRRFFRENRLVDNGRAEELFLEFQSSGAPRSANQIDKSQYIKKSLQVEDQITAKINDKVSAVSALKLKFENSVKKLEEAKVLSKLK
eukprot:TRINITY_DN696_c0_g1_i4.p3 TRINITY_DN696_c0_g1~~TRINITY_DN696_c0_g1_i4.p3  ORF type:complete len:145 (+),score=50.11 TRINITY_DN696_c0_g1_i4:162-596(+)